MAPNKTITDVMATMPEPKSPALDHPFLKSLESKLAVLRASGWGVAVHNDYCQDGTSKTFYLFTRGDGPVMEAVEGEGTTDDVALDNVIAKLFTAVKEGVVKPYRVAGQLSGLARSQQVSFNRSGSLLPAQRRLGQPTCQAVQRKQGRGDWHFQRFLSLMNKDVLLARAVELLRLHLKDGSPFDPECKWNDGGPCYSCQTNQFLDENFSGEGVDDGQSSDEETSRDDQDGVDAAEGTDS